MKKEAAEILLKLETNFYKWYHHNLRNSTVTSYVKEKVQVWKQLDLDMIIM